MSNLFITFNHDSKHTYVMRALSSIENMSNWISVGDKLQWVYLEDDRIQLH